MALSCPDFKLSDSPVSIRFNNETGSKDLTDPGSPIPQERFRFCKDELLGLANTNTHLPRNPLIFLANMSLINQSTPESWMRIKVFCNLYVKSYIVYFLINIILTTPNNTRNFFSHISF